MVKRVLSMALAVATVVAACVPNPPTSEDNTAAGGSASGTGGAPGGQAGSSAGHGGTGGASGAGTGGASGAGTGGGGSGGAGGPACDKDKDGHAALGAVGCAEPADDCDDTDVEVFPGQKTWFAKPSKSGGWDYNCNGVDEIETLTGTCPGICPLCAGGTPGYVGTPPGCGMSAVYGTKCGCGGLSCALSPSSSKQQRCH